MDTLTMSRRERDWMTIMIGIKRQELTLVLFLLALFTLFRRGCAAARGAGGRVEKTGLNFGSARFLFRCVFPFFNCAWQPVQKRLLS